MPKTGPWKFGAVSFLFLLLFLRGHARFPSPNASFNLEVRFHGIADGLSSRNVYQIFEDQRGMIWAATEQGLDVFNGQRFQVFNSVMPGLLPLPGRIVYQVAEDSLQRLWVCTSGGPVVIDATRRKLLPFSVVGIPETIYRQPNFTFTANPDGGLWIFAGNTLYTFNIVEGKPVWFKIAHNPYSSKHKPEIFSTGNGECWMLDKIHGLSLLRSSRFEKVEGEEFPYPGNLYPKVTIAGHTGDSLTLFRNFTYQLFSVNKRKEGIQASIQKQTLEQQDPRWAYVLRYLDDNPGIAGGNIVNPSWISKDRSGNTWYATNIGIFLVRTRTGLNFRQVGAVKGYSVRGIWGDNEGLKWVGAYKGAFYLGGKGPVRFYPNLKAIWQFVPESPDVFWIARESESSLSRFRFQNERIILDSSPPLGFALSLCPWESMLLAGGNSSEIAVLDRKTGKTFYTINLDVEKTAYEQVLPAAKAMLRGKDSSVWIGGNAGLFHLVKGRNGRLYLDKSVLPKLSASLRINALYLDAKNNLWIGSSGEGLFRYNLYSGDFTNYRTVDGLSNDVVYSILGSHSDSLLWIGTQKGLSCLNVYAGSFSNYYAEDGLADNEFNTAATWKAPDGYLYMGGINGITYFKPEVPVRCESNTEVFISLDLIDLDKEGKKNRWFPTSGDTLHLNPINQYLDISFQSNTHFDSEDIIFRFQIHNSRQRPWQYLRSGEKLILNHLPSGMNQLIVQARNPRGNWGTSYQLFLYMSPPWYKTWQFNALLVVTSLSLIYFFFRLRLNKYRREYAIRKKISADLHDEFGGRLYALNVLAQQIQSPSTPEAEVPRLSQHFQQLSVETLRTARNFIWAFDPGSDRLGNLIDRMEDFCNTTISPLVPSLKFNRDILPYNRKISTKIKHYTLMIFQELLTNIVKHSNSESISVLVYLRDKSLVIRISNYYWQHKRQIPSEKCSSGQGLHNIANRVKAIGAIIESTDNGHLNEVTLSIKKWQR